MTFFFFYYDPQSFRVLLFGANEAFYYLNLAGITKFNCERRNEKDSGCSRKNIKTPSYK